MINKYTALITFTLILNSFEVNARNECIRKDIPNSDSVCVCNSSYCDDFPPIVRPKAQGVVLVYESNKIGDRFKEKVIEIHGKHLKNVDKSEKKSITIAIDKDLEYQSIDGFGGAFTDTTGMLLKSVPKSLATAIIDSYFSSNGIEYSFGRVPISGTDYSVRPYTYDDIENDKNLTHFALQREDYEWKIPFIKLAQNLSRHPIKLIGTSWSPPGWMKTVNDVQAFAPLKGAVGGEYYQIYANYVLKFLESYREQGIEFWGLTVQNEPCISHNINGLNMTPEMERDFIELNLGPTLVSAGFTKSKLKLMMFDDTTNFMREWVDTILTHRPSAQYLSGIVVHWYYNEILGEFPNTLLDYVYQNYPDYFVLNSEACSLTGAQNGNWSYAENYAFDIIRDINHWMTGWLEWNMALDMDGGPTWMVKHGCGGPVYIDPDAKEAYKQPTFYALGHFSKFISPESVRIAHELSDEIPGLHVLTVKRPDSAVVVVVLNINNEEIALNIDIKDRNYFSNTISGHSIQSYIYWD